MSLTRTRSGLFRPSSAMPADQFTNVFGRLYGQNTGRVNAKSLVVALEANPTMRTTEFPHDTLHVLLQDPVGGVGLADSTYAIAHAALLTPPMPAYPAFRIFPLNEPFSEWFSQAHWVAVTANAQVCWGIRQVGDPRIGLDIESYSFGGTSGAGVEPTVDSIASFNASNGTTYTPEQLRTAMQPFIDWLLANGVCVIGMYPCVFGTAGGIPLVAAYIAQALGADRISQWWENAKGFGSAELFRSNLAINGFYSGAADQALQQAEYDRTMLEGYGVTGQTQHVPVSDDDEHKRWGAAAEPGPPPSSGAAMSAWGRLRWLYYGTQAGTAVGTQAWIDGTDIHVLNGVDYVWWMRPLFGTISGGTIVTSVGISPTPIDTEIWAGSASVLASNPSQMINTSVEGLQIPPPVGGSGLTWCAVRENNSLPAISTDEYTVVIPPLKWSSLPLVDTPIWSAAVNNSQSVQVIYWAAENKIVLQVKASGVNSYDIVTGIVAGTMYKIAIGRSGTTWRYSANGAVATSVVAPSQAAVLRSPMLGMGVDRAMGANSMIPGTGTIFIGQLMTYLTLRSGAEFQTLSTYRAPGAADYTTYTYPFLRGI